MLVRRMYIAQSYAEFLPYALVTAGWCESHADHPDGTEDRGAGAAGGIGAGFHMMKDSSISWAAEFRILRLGAGLRRTGVSGMTTIALTTSLFWRSGPKADWFGR
ncbi:MAG: hypothetical protein HY925_05010 [Elusimicrobia bacterium]|nr:hypothetical protein [Elusimicrobiota bacterium]